VRFSFLDHLLTILNTISYTVNIAPVFPSLAEPEVNSTLPFLSYDPRCLKRDVSVWTSSNWTKDIDSYNLITNNGSNIFWFQEIMQGNNFAGGSFGVHTAGNTFSEFN
jgi:tyrosinase